MSDKTPVVGIVMGSKSDMDVVARCTRQLDELGIAYEFRVISAHRTPDAAHEYAATAGDRGLKVVIAAAGMSAALAGVLAASTTLPVIGIPVASGPLAGTDAALSTLQMPPGVPVGCMTIGGAGATNAAIYAARILALSDPKLAERLVLFKTDQAQKVADDDREVRGASS
jgi:phosphoribosylaminoimidazole carboxylase PurE protein